MATKKPLKSTAKGSKNNAAIRGKGASLRTVGEKNVIPVKFYGGNGGSFIACAFPDKKEIVMINGKPLPHAAASQSKSS